MTDDILEQLDKCIELLEENAKEEPNIRFFFHGIEVRDMEALYLCALWEQELEKENDRNEK